MSADEKQEEIPQEKTGPYIEFNDVSKAFGENRVLDHVSFDVMPGETVCILGRSGVGKSVALHHIMGFLKPDAGRVIVAHEDITDYDEEHLGRTSLFRCANKKAFRKNRFMRLSMACWRWLGSRK